MQRIVLVGPMGAGKSTIGRLLAKQLDLPFKDSDLEIEERTGADIKWIFDVEGEEGFRRRETTILSDLMREKCLVLATGGGVVTRRENRHLLSQADAVIYLSTTPKQLLKRTQRDKKRPLLDVPDPEVQICKLLNERDPLYRMVATETVMTNKQSPRDVAKQIVQSILTGSS